jgi:glycosyltransferase involved in cell wall biosynthesis
MKRVLYVHNSADAYGASRSLLRLTERLDRSRFRPLVLLPEPGTLRERLEALDVPVFVDPGLAIITRGEFTPGRLPGFLSGIPPSAARVAALVRRHRIDVVHTNVGTILASALGARLAGAHHVWHIRDWFQEFRSFWTLYRRYILGLSDRVLCVSKAIAEQFPVSPRIEVLHNGFNPAEFDVDRARLRAEFRTRWKIPEAEVVIGCVGRIKFGRKGQDVLARAAKLLADANASFTLLIVGAEHPTNPGQDRMLRELIASLGLEARCILTGELPDVRPAYAAMDTLVLPSAQPEPFGGVVLEAMGMGLPVVGTAIGGTPDQIDDGVTGLLVAPADPADLAAKLGRLLQDPGRRAEMGAAGRRRLADVFSMERMIRRIERVYEGLG